MAFVKSSSASVVNPNVTGKAWIGRTADPRKKVASEVLSAFDSSKWLLSHVSIMASVDVENDVPSDPKKNWRIIPEHSIFVNNNGDAWERKLLARTYGTFLGANNYVEHLQQVALAKGKVIDVALREVPLGKRMDGTPITTLYVDILIATSWEHEDLCRKILSGEFNAVSMGCSCKYTICTRCGKIAHDETELCEHVKYYRRQNYYDNDGTQRVIAELCGSADDPSSVVFVDASWVRNPAFPGAVLRSIINPPAPPAGLDVSENVFSPVQVGQNSVSIESLFYGAPKAPATSAKKPGGYSPGEDSLLKSLVSRVQTETPHHQTMLRAASGADMLDKISREVLAAEGDEPPAPAAGGAEADRFSLGEEGGGGAPEGGATEGGSLDDLLSGADSPAPDAGGGEPPAPDAGGGEPPAPDAGGDAGAGGDAAPEGKKPPSAEAMEAPLGAIKDQVRDSILNQIKQDLMDGAKDMSGQTMDAYSETQDSDQLMRYASAAASRGSMLSVWKKKAVDVCRIKDRRIAAALLMLDVAPITKLASFGYNSVDLLRVLQYIDNRGGKPVVSTDALNYMGRKLASKKITLWDKVATEREHNVRFLRDFIILAGRTPSKEESSRMWQWYKLAKMLPSS